MARKKCVLAEYDPKGKPSFASKYVKVERMVKATGIKVWFDASTAQKVLHQVNDKLEATFAGEFDGNTFQVLIVFDGKMVSIAKLELDDISDLKKRRAAMAGIIKLKLANKAMYVAFDKQNPDPKTIKDLEFEVYDGELQISSLESGIETLKDFSYAKHHNSGRGDLMLSLQETAKKKGFGDFFEFLRHASYKKPAFLVETYLVKKAPKELKLPSSIRGPIEKAIAANKKPDLKKVTQYAHNIIDKRVVKSWAPKLIKASVEELRDYKKKVARARKKLDYYGIKAR